MLEFSLRRVLAIRGVSNAVKFMTNNGFTRASAVHLYDFKVVNIKVKNLEKLCRALNCTPNDFFKWKDAEGAEPLPETHALNALRREKSAEINNLMQEIPVERLDEVENFLREMKSKD